MTVDLLPVQEFLLTRSPRDLFTAHGVAVSADSTGRVVSVSYDQIMAKKSDPLVLECRGLVLRLLDGTFNPDQPLGATQVLARPFRRFFNHGEGGPEHQIDLTNPAVTYENKEDGTLIILYFDESDANGSGRWHVATRSVPRGDQKASRLGGDVTFRELFLRSLGVEDLDRWASQFFGANLRLSGRNTYLFELTTPLNEVFVRQDKFRLTLLGVRDRTTGMEYDPTGFTAALGVPTPKVHQFANAAEAFTYIHSQPPKEHEGMVAKILVRPGVYHRAKIKNAAYVAASHVQGGNGAINSPRSLMTLILTGAFGDVESTLNAHTADVGRKMEAGLAAYCQEQDAAYDRLYVPGMTRKELAVAMGTAGLNVASCFARFDGKVANFAGYIQSQRQADGWRDGVLDSLIKACGVKA